MPRGRRRPGNALRKDCWRATGICMRLLLTAGHCSCGSQKTCDGLCSRTAESPRPQRSSQRKPAEREAVRLCTEQTVPDHTVSHDRFWGKTTWQCRTGPFSAKAVSTFPPAPCLLKFLSFGAGGRFAASFYPPREGAPFRGLLAQTGSSGGLGTDTTSSFPLSAISGSTPVAARIFWTARRMPLPVSVTRPARAKKV